MYDYQLIIKLLRVTDKRDPHVPGLPLKQIVNVHNMHIGLFDESYFADRNVIGFDNDGNFAWVISDNPTVPQNFKHSWIKLEVDDEGGVIAVSADGHKYHVDPSNGSVSPA